MDSNFVITQDNHKPYVIIAAWFHGTVYSSTTCSEELHELERCKKIIKRQVNELLESSLIAEVEIITTNHHIRSSL